MSDRLKIFLKLAAFLGICVLLAYGMYRLFFGGVPDVDTTPVATDGTPTGGLVGSGAANPLTGETADGDDDDGTTGLPEADTVASGGSTLTRLLTNTDVLSPTVTSSGTIAYYDPADGYFYTITDNGEVQKLSGARFPDAETVTFANEATAAVIEFPDGSNVIYGFTTGKQVTLPNHWEDFSFSDDGSEVASKSIGNDPSNRTIVISSTDGTRTQSVAVLGENDDKVDVNVSPTGNIVAFSRTGTAQSGFGRSEYYLIDDEGEAIGNLIVEGSSFSPVWSPDGAHILYSVADASDAYRPSLWYVDSAGDRHGDTRINLGVATWVEKCVFASSSTLYCAVPQTMVDGGGSEHSLVTSPDSLYKIDVPSGRTTLLGFAAAETQMSNLSLSTTGDTLYYQDAYGRINAMDLR